MQDIFPCICNYARKLRFCCNFGSMCKKQCAKNIVFWRELANTLLTKELKAFFAFDESRPTFAILSGQTILTTWYLNLNQS